MTHALDDLTPSEPLTVRSFSAIGTTASVVVQEPSKAEAAERMLRAEIESIDLACSRFRSDSELEMVHAHAGAAVRVSSLLFDALAVSYEVAERTHGAVDPTIGNAIAALGYDKDLKEVQARPRAPGGASALQRRLHPFASQFGPPDGPYPSRSEIGPGFLGQGVRS